MDIAITSLEDTQQKSIKIEDVATLWPTASTPKIAWGGQGYILLSVSIIAWLSLEEMRNNTTVVSTNAGASSYNKVLSICLTLVIIKVLYKHATQWNPHSWLPRGVLKFVFYGDVR